MVDHRAAARPGDHRLLEHGVGLKALAEDGTHLGEIVSVQNFGAGDLLELKPLAGASEFIPFEDQWVPKVDLATRSVVIKRPPSTGDETDDADAGESDQG